MVAVAESGARCGALWKVVNAAKDWRMAAVEEEIAARVW
jgi:hypothetical protein